MGMADLFGVGGAWTRSFRADPQTARSRCRPADRQLASVKLNTASGNAAEVNAIRDRMRTAATSLRDAVRHGYTRENKRGLHDRRRDAACGRRMDLRHGGPR